jgi:hypothetical protein
MFKVFRPFIKFKCRFHNELFENGANPVELQPWISLRSKVPWGAIYCSVVLELARSSSLEHHFRGGKVRLLQRSSKSREDCSGGVLEPRWSNLLHGKPFFPTRSAVMRLLSGKSCSSVESRAKVNPKINLIRKTFKLRIYTLYKETICRPPQSRETIPITRLLERHQNCKN